MRTLSDETFARIVSLMHGSIGIALAPNRKPLVSSRLAPRMQRLGIDDFDDYLALIERDEGVDGEFQVAVDLLTTHETYFFREPAHFNLLADEVARTRPRSLAVWSAATSFGDEAYSTAMQLAELQQQGRLGADWSVLGTDIADQALREAVAGVYPAQRLRFVSADRLRRFCLRGEGDSEGLVQIAAPLRERARFGQLNLCAPFAPLGPFDIVFLRNVLIYFDAATKRAVVERVLAELRPGGLFFVGTAEGRPAGAAGLQPLAPGAFRKAG